MIGLNTTDLIDHIFIIQSVLTLMDLLQIFSWISPSMILSFMIGVISKRHWIVEKSKRHKKLYLAMSLLTLPEACYAIYILATNEEITKRWNERKKQKKITDFS